MLGLEAALLDYAEAKEAFREAARRGPVPDDLLRRRDAALRRVHYFEDPWQACRCRICSFSSV